MKSSPAKGLQMYAFNDVNTLASLGTKHLETWLSSRKETTKVVNVEEDARYRQLDVDLLWATKRNPKGYRVEVKVDRYYGTGNFFFETHSNVEKNTPGCFLYTEADLLFYYFIEPRHLFVLPMPRTRVWFLEHKRDFRVKATTTPVSNSFYTTRGRLVPRNRVLAEVPGVHAYRL